jgi:uncharacterized membrane protein
MKPARLFGHSTHPPTTHVPLGLGLVAPLWYALALATGRPRWWLLAFWTVVAAAAGSLPALATGLLEFVSVAERAPEERLACLHMAVMVAAAALLGAAAVAQGGDAAPQGAGRWMAPVCAFAAAAVLGFGGWLGGELVSQYGAGTDFEPPQEVQ